MTSDRQYLGDGVYVEIVDGMVKLTTENGTDVPSNSIYLDVDVMHAFDTWWTRMQEKYKSRDDLG